MQILIIAGSSASRAADHPSNLYYSLFVTATG